MDAGFIQEIRRAVESRRERAESVLQELVRIPSVTGEEGPVQEAVERIFRETGLSTVRCETNAGPVAPYLEHVGLQKAYENRPNVIGRRAGSGGGRSLLLNAHVDTVASGDPAHWSRDPFSGAIEGDLLYGRGACDMKAGLVGYLVALEALSDLNIELRGDVTVTATVGEEDGGVGALTTILAGYRADAVVISEPTRLALVPAQGGSLVFRLTVRGRSAHAAVRDRGVSALEKFLPILEELRALERERNSTLSHPLYECLANKAPINIGVVNTGNWASTVPESLVAEGRAGLIPGERLGTFRERVESRIERAATRDPWLRKNPPEIEWFGGQFEPAEIPANAPICRAISRAHEQFCGRSPKVEGVPYGADMRLFIRFGGMPCVMYGAGDIDLAHRADEHISVSELLTAAKTISCVLADWCEGGRR